METRLGKKAEMIKEKNRIKAEILKELDKKMTAAYKKILEK